MPHLSQIRRVTLDGNHAVARVAYHMNEVIAIYPITTDVARVAMGANDAHTVKVFHEAESYPGTAVIIAYAHCIGQGYDLSRGMEQQKAAVASGYCSLGRLGVSGHGLCGSAKMILSHPSLQSASWWHALCIWC